MDGMVERAAYELADFIIEEMQLYKADEDTEDVGIEEVVRMLRGNTW